jgi:hypothetical protein
MQLARFLQAIPATPTQENHARDAHTLSFGLPPEQKMGLSYRLPRRHCRCSSSRHSPPSSPPGAGVGTASVRFSRTSCRLLRFHRLSSAIASARSPSTAHASTAGSTAPAFLPARFAVLGQPSRTTEPARAPSRGSRRQLLTERKSTRSCNLQALFLLCSSSFFIGLNTCVRNQN